jgi:DNA-binding transcriptional MerR regulator
MRIGQLAARAGVTTDTIRYYERIGLLPRAKRNAAGYREYSESDIDQIGLVRNAVSFGFSLKEVAKFLNVRKTGGTPCRDVRATAARMLAAVDQQIEDLLATRKRMSETLRTWDTRLAHTPTGCPAHLLAYLEGKATTPPRFRLKTQRR